MIRLLTFFSLVVLFVVYSAVVYTTGTESGIRLTTAEQQLINKGKSLYQAKKLPGLSPAIRTWRLPWARSYNRIFRQTPRPRSYKSFTSVRRKSDAGF